MSRLMVYILFLLFISLVLEIPSFSKELAMLTELSNEDLSVQDKLMYKFIAQTGKKIGEKYNIHPCGIGGGANEGIWLMSLSFQHYGSSLTEEEARRLIINCVNDFLEIVNKDDQLKPFLKVYPFSAKNLDFNIFSYNAERRETYHPYIRVVSSTEGKVSFFTKEKSNEFKYKSKKYETYDEAMAILQKEKEQDSNALELP